jgi:hypothetical protein
MEDLVHTKLLKEENKKRKKKTQRVLMMPSIAFLMACFIGFLIYSAKNYASPTDVPYEVFSE